MGIEPQLWDVLKWFVGVIASLLGVIALTERKKISALFSWKDNTVDPFMRNVGVSYVQQTRCDRTHENLDKKLDDIVFEFRRTRNMFERHLGINGGDREGP